MMADLPALLPLVKLKLSCAELQLAKVTVAVPTSTCDGSGFVT
jgi:hypothetical protein